MSKNIVECLNKIKESQNVLELVNTITQPNAMQNAHYKDKLKSIWWYNVVSKQFLISDKAKSHWSPEHFPEITNIGGSWVRGRIYQEGGKNYIMLYSDDFPHGRVPGSVVDSIYRSVVNKFNEPIADFVDQEGYSLLGE